MNYKKDYVECECPHCKTLFIIKKDIQTKKNDPYGLYCPICGLFDKPNHFNTLNPNIVEI